MTDLSHQDEKKSHFDSRELTHTKIKRSSLIEILPYPLIALTFIMGLFIGDGLDFSQSWSALMGGANKNDSAQVIMWWIRIPQLLTALFAGAVLSISGAAMQQLLRNDLADPYLLGIASGGGLGAAIALSLGLVDQYGLWILPVSSFFGAFLVLVGDVREFWLVVVNSLWWLSAAEGLVWPLLLEVFMDPGRPGDVFFFVSGFGFCIFACVSVFRSLLFVGVVLA